MPKHISEKEIESIASLLTAHPSGWRIGEIIKALESNGQSFNLRTLQRRLSRLEKTGRILIAGVGRATRYTLLSLKKNQQKPLAVSIFQLMLKLYRTRFRAQYLFVNRLVTNNDLSITINPM